MLIIVSGSAGVGKNTIITKLLEKYDNIKLLQTCTTRMPRSTDEAMHNPNEVFEYLSDLIEPEPERTCHIVWNELDDTWECDACGGAVGLSYVSYCESCGAKNNNPSN